MVEEVEVTNFGKGGVASEETLVDLLKAIEYLAKKEGFDPKKTAKKVKELGESLDDTIDVVDDNRKAIEDNTDSVKENTKANKSMFGYLGNAIGVVGTSLVNFSAELIDGGSKLTDFTQHIPVVGSTLARLTGYFDDTMDSFRELSNVGASFNNSLVELRMASASAYMTLGDFTRFVADNSEKLAAFGGTATKGAKSIASLNQALGNQREELLNMGFSFEDINEAMIDYAYLTRSQGRIETRNQQVVAAEAAEYAKTLQTLSKLTGQDVDAIREKQTQQQNDLVFQMKMSKMGATEQAKVRKQLAEAELLGPAAVARVKETVLGLPPMTEETRLFVATLGEVNSILVQTTRAAMDNTIGAEEFNRLQEKNTVDMIAAMVAGAKNMEDLLAVGAASGEGLPAEILALFEKSGIDLGKYIGMTAEAAATAISADLEAAKTEADERGKVTSAFASFENTIRKAREEIITNFIDSGVFDLMTSTVSGLADTISDPQFIGALKDAIIDVTNFLSGFIEDIKSGDFKTAIDNAFKDVGQIIKEFLFGTSGEERKSQATEEISNLSSQIANLNSEKLNLGLSLKDDMEPDPQLVRQINLIDQRIARLSEQRQEEQTILQTPTQDLKTEGVLSTLGPMLVDAGSSAITEGFKKLFENSTLVTGVATAIAGIWAVKKVADAASSFKKLFGIGTDVESGRESNQRGGGRGIGRGAGVGLRVLAGGLKAIANPLALVGLGVGLGAVTLAIMGIGKAVQIAAPGIEAFGGALKNVLEGLAPVIKAFAPIIEAMGLAIRDTFEGLGSIISSTADPINAALGGISGIFDSVGGVIENSLNSIANVAESLGTAISAPITAAGDAIQGVINSINEYRTAGVEATTDQIERLANIPGTNLVDAARGVEMMKTALAGFEPGFWEGLGDWFTGGARQDSMISTTNVITDMARAFADLDPEAVEKASTSVASLSTALQTFNSATAIESVGDLASRLIGYQDAANAIVILATSLENISGENLTNVAPSIAIISSVVGEFQALTAISSIGEGVSAVLQSYVPLSQSITDVATKLGSIKTPENLTAISPALMSIISAIDSFQSLTAISSLGEGVSAMLDSYSAVTTPLIELINALAPIDGTQLQNVAPGIKAISDALEIFRTSAGFSGLGDYVSSFFDEDTSEVGAKISQIAIDLQQIDAAKLSEASAGIITMSEAFNTFATSEAGSFDISRSSIRNLERISELSGTGFRDLADGLNALASLDINSSLESINSGFNTENITTYTSALQNLIETLEELNQTMSQSQPAQSNTNVDNISQATARGTSTNSMDQLNITLQKLYEESLKTSEFAKKIERNTKSFGRDVSTGRVSNL